MANDTAQPGKPTVVYSPLRLNWKNVVAGTVIALLIVAIGVFAFSYYNPDATPVPPVVIKSGTKSAKVATKSSEKAIQKDVTAGWKNFKSDEGNFSVKYPPTSTVSTSEKQIIIKSSGYSETTVESCGPQVVKKGWRVTIAFESFAGKSNTLNELVDFEDSNTSSDFASTDKSNYQLNSTPAKRYVYKGPSKTSDCVLSSEEKLNRILAVNTSGIDFNITSRYLTEGEKDSLEIFNQILSTFKFLD